ncbi:MAG: M14 family metallopeptidase [Thermoanaerobaculia bacterium]
MKRFVLSFALGVFCAAVAAAAEPLPTPQEFHGYALGARFTSHERILAYFDALAARSELVTVERYGESSEGRPLVYAVITSPENRSRLAEIRSAVAELNRPDATTDDRAAAIAKSNPAIVWLAYGIHGNESSSSEAAMMVASTLLRDDPEMRALREKLVIVIDPLENPDGRERYIGWFRQSLGVSPNASPDALEHHEPWPGGRYNHYLVDMNRDWAWATQKETRARIAAYFSWRPQVFVDLHEMGFESSYFFPPDANPINANIQPDTQKWLDVFGRANAEAFASRGWSFFVGELFDLFYPGYGDSWPSLRGAVGMTYEVSGGGRAGLAIRREDGSVLTLADRAERHYTTSMATLRTAAANNSELLMHTWRSLRSNYENARTTYLIPPGTPNVDAALRTLARQGVDIRTLRAPTRFRATRIDNDSIETREFPTGTAVISTRQPSGAIARSLLERTPAFSPEFLEGQRKKIDADEEDEFYDVTAWSIPISHNIAAFATDASVPPDLPLWHARAPLHELGRGRFGYLIDGRDPEVYRAVGRMLRAGIRFSVSRSVLETGFRKFAPGTILIQRANNEMALDETLKRALDGVSVDLVSVDTAWSGGVALGSNRIRFVREPRIAIVGGEGTSPTSFGTTWHTLDVDAEIPHTVVPLRRLKSMDLGQYRVIVLPDGHGYSELLGKSGIERLQRWVKEGGVLVGIRGGAEFFREKETGLSKVKPWAPPGSEKEGEESEPEIEETRYNDYRVPGAAFRTTMNANSFLTFGVDSAPAVLVEGDDVLLPTSHTVDNILTIRSEAPLASGFAWPESIERLAGSAFVVNEPHGEGSVITFAGEPHYRLYWRGTLPIFLNAVLYGPSLK